MSNFESSHTSFGCQSKSSQKSQTHIRYIDQGILPDQYDKATAGSANIDICQILTLVIPVSDVDKTQTQLKIVKISDQTHISLIDRGILSVRYDKATARSENMERCQILTPLIQVLDVDQTQTQLKIANVSYQTHIRHMGRGIRGIQTHSWI